MPKVVNYASRFVLVREAAFAVVRDRGPAALSRHTVAAALGTSVNTVRRLVDPGADLRGLAADEVRRRQRHGRYGRLRDAEPVDTACHVVRGLLPDESRRVAEELVWLRLQLDAARLPAHARATETPVSTAFQVAEHGHPAEAGTDPDVGAAVEPDPVAHHRQDYEEEVALRIDQAVVVLDAVDRPSESVRLRAVIDGVILGVCLGRLTPEEGVAAVERHLRLVFAAAGLPG